MMNIKKTAIFGMALMTFTSLSLLTATPGQAQSKAAPLPLQCESYRDSQARNIMFVSTPAGLKKAIELAQGGQTIKLAPGNYGSLNYLSGKKPNSIVTLVSAVKNNPAIIESTSISNASNFTFINLKFFAEGTGKVPSWGDKKAPLGDFIDNRGVRLPVQPGDSALGLKDVNNIRISHSLFSGHNRAIYVKTSKNIRITDNVFVNTTMDHMTFTGVDGVLIEGNYMGAFKTFWSGHNDVIQFFATPSNTPSKNITIRNNVMTSSELPGSKGGVQAVFMFNEKVARNNGTLSDFHKNILVEDNTIVTTHVNALVIGAADGVTVRNNTVLSECGRGGSDPRISIYSGNKNVSVKGNKANVLHAADKVVTKKVSMPSNWDVSGNKITGECISPPRVYSPGCKN